ncbi:MAG: GntR family transcriptional regulator, partial [Pedosphaera sp.]|nr:GntR family transcriptional regulator [Pedosphaera sp.]
IQTAEALRRGIAGGEWSGHLPGELELCDRLQVSRVTLRTALKQLTREGLVQARQGSRREIIASGKPRRPAATPRVVLLSPVPTHAMPAPEMFWVDALREKLAADAHPLEIHTNKACYSAHPEAALQTLADELRPAAWVLYLSTPAMQGWFAAQGLPCVVSGSVHPGISLSALDVDYAAVARHAVGMFAAHGCRQLALLMPRSEQAGNWETERGFTEAGRRLAGPKRRTRVIHHDGSVAGVCAAVDAALAGPERVDGLFIAKPAHVITVASHLGQRGVRVPAEVSLISRDDDPFLSHLVPEVARYTRSAELFARKLSRLVLALADGGAERTRAVRLMPDFTPGGTLRRLA